MIEFYLALTNDIEDKNKIMHIYTTYYSYMTYCASQIMTENASDVEDVVHDAMISIIDHLQYIDFDNNKRIRNFCGIVARNKAIDYCRKNGKAAVPVEKIFEYNHDGDDPETVVINKSLYETVVGAIDNLDMIYKDVCLLKYVNNLKEKEISELLNIPMKTVNSRIYRAKHLLREALREEGFHV